MTVDEARIVIAAFAGHTMRPYQQRALATAFRIVDDAAMVIAGREEIEQMKLTGNTDLTVPELEWLSGKGVIVLERG